MCGACVCVCGTKREGGREREERREGRREDEERAVNYCANLILLIMRDRRVLCY